MGARNGDATRHTDADAAHFREVIRIAAPPSRLYGTANVSGTLQRGGIRDGDCAAPCNEAETRDGDCTEIMWRCIP